MVILNQGLDTLTEQIAPLFSKGQWGTGTTIPDVTDTDLETAVAATLLATTSTTSGTSVQLTHELSSTLGNGSALTEFSIKFSDDESFDRTVGGAVNKTSEIQLTTITTVNIIRG